MAHRHLGRPKRRTAFALGCALAMTPAYYVTAARTSAQSVDAHPLASREVRAREPRAGWPGPFADFGATTAWTRRVPRPAPTDAHSAAWVQALFAPPGVATGEPGDARYAGRLQFCTRAAYVATHVTDGHAALASAGCAAGDSGATLVFATSGDPTYTLACHEFGPACAAENVTVHIPRGTTANANSDHHLAVIDAAAARECDLWETGWLAPTTSTGLVGNGPDLAIGNGGCGSLRGDGSGPAWQATGANVPLSAGLLRARDVLGRSGDGSDGRIAHALYVTIPCASREHEYPASGSDGATPGCAPEGARFFLTTAGLAKFERAQPPIPRWEMTIVRAYHEYGLIVSDHGGDAFGLLLEDDASAIFAGAAAPWSQKFIAFARRDAATARAKIDLTPARDVYHVDLAVPGDLTQTDWAVAAPCVNHGTCSHDR